MIKQAIVFLMGAGVMAQNAGNLTEQYRDRASKLIDASLADQGGMEKLAYLCDRIGNRLSGSAALEKAVVWAAAQMKADGLTNVVTPRVKVPHWVRGNESAALTGAGGASAHHPGARRQRGHPQARHHGPSGAGVEFRGSGKKGPRRD